MAICFFEVIKFLVADAKEEAAEGGYQGYGIIGVNEGLEEDVEFLEFAGSFDVTAAGEGKRDVVVFQGAGVLGHVAFVVD